MGHAGHDRRALLWRMCAFTALWLVTLLAWPRQASALVVQFPNGGSAQLDASGNITGIAQVGDYDNDTERFGVIMPDGTEVFGECLDPDHFVPAPGNYPFVAEPLHSGGYEVTISTVGAQHGPQPYPDKTYLDPPQRVGNIVWKPTYFGWVKIKKASELPDVTKDNKAYTLEGARYRIYKDQACTDPVETPDELVTDDSGVTPCVALDAGTYWVKEEQAPKGYLVDVEPHDVHVVDKTLTTLETTDTPQFARQTAWATKTDAQYHGPQGSGSLANAQFLLRFYAGKEDAVDVADAPTRSWVVRSDEQGNVFPSEDHLVSGGALYHDKDGNVILPFGILTIQEIKAPYGYWLEGQTKDSGLEYEAPVHTVAIASPDGFEAPIIQEDVRRCGLSLQKTDVQTGMTPQGDASLEGIAFSIVNRSEHAVVVDGDSFEPGEVVAIISTNEQGIASTTEDFLPLGTYEVKEAATNGSYALTAQSQTIKLSPKATNTVVRLSQTVQDQVVRGGIAVKKVSRDLNDALPQGEATLANAVFSVTLQSRNPVVVNGSVFHTGDVVTSLKTNDKGLARTGDHELPYGTYVVQEVEAPTGYLLNTSWSKTVEVHEDGVVHTLADEDSTPDEVKRGGFTFNKVDELTKERMARVAWRITSDATGETHILVTGDDGVADTERCPHTAQTNANDAIVREDGSIDEDRIDLDAGIWFTGRTDLPATARDDALALPYDVYTVEELRSSANEGHDLVTFRIRVHADKHHANMGDVVNRSTERPAIATTLSYANNDHVAPVATSVTLTDVVAYRNLPVGEEYRLVGTLVNKATKEPLVNEDGSPLTQTVSFTPIMPAGSIEMPFEVNTSTLSGTSIVAYEQLFKGDDCIAEHADIDDADQTVAIPAIGTTLSDEEGNHEVVANDQIVLVDTVTYHNLVPNVSYEITGLLIDKDSGEPLCDQEGQELHGATSFVPTQSDGTATVTFSLNRQSAFGKTIVAYETLTRLGMPLVSHADQNDSQQTVCVPDIQTELTDTEGHHTIASAAKTELVDTVTFRGLTPGESYRVEGVLMDKLTGELVKDDTNNDLTSSTTFVPTSSVGSVSLTFVVDTSTMAGTEIVAFETLYKDDRQLAIHADLEDRAQTVYIPSIRTLLASAEGTHETHTGQNVLTDVVSYSGLRPGIPYTLSGTLVDAATAEPLKDDNDKDVCATAEFTPESSDGEASVTFELDTAPYTGKQLVAYEYLYEGSGTEGRLVAKHEDPSDSNQTVSVPFVATTACDATDGDKTIETSDKVKIRDTVSYKGLEPGCTYEMTGSVHHVATAEPLQTKDGDDVTSQTTFEPKQADGTVELEFEFDSDLVDDEDLVVFESCTQNGVEVASHADIHDKNQMVHVTKPSTPPTNKVVPPTDTPSSKASTAASPSTGDATLAPVAIVLAVAGIAALCVRKFLF